VFVLSRQDEFCCTRSAKCRQLRQPYVKNAVDLNFIQLYETRNTINWHSTILSAGYGIAPTALLPHRRQPGQKEASAVAARLQIRG
jgi:hypothetical protein